MEPSYPITWRSGPARPATGRLELGEDALELVGASDGELVRERIPYRELVSVAVGSGSEDRIGGRQALVLGREGRAPLRIAGVAQTWVVSELAERIASLRARSGAGRSRLAVVVPIRATARERARALLRRGAPFDPEAAGLDRHTALLGEREVVFVFEAEAAESIERLLRRPELWDAAEAWRDIVDGPAGVPEVVYDWERSSSRVHGLGL